jgi:antitoxin FitA
MKANEQEPPMATLTIRNIDDKLVAKIKRQAKKNHRSLESEARFLLERAMRTESRADFWQLADQIAAMTPKGRQTDSTEIIRKMRDER